MNNDKSTAETPLNSDTGSNGLSPAMKKLLQMEGAAIFIVACLFYSQQEIGWKVFFLLFLFPDCSFLGYLGGAKVGALAYNVAHSYVGAVLLLAAGFYMEHSVATALGLIWCGHIGFDRMLGYGLKYSTAFNQTHLGRIGKHKKV